MGLELFKKSAMAGLQHCWAVDHWQEPTTVSSALKEWNAQPYPRLLPAYKRRGVDFFVLVIRRDWEMDQYLTSEDSQNVQDST